MLSRVALTVFEGNLCEHLLHSAQVVVALALLLLHLHLGHTHFHRNLAQIERMRMLLLLLSTCHHGSAQFRRLRRRHLSRLKGGARRGERVLIRVLLLWLLCAVGRVEDVAFSRCLRFDARHGDSLRDDGLRSDLRRGATSGGGEGLWEERMWKVMD